MRTDRPRRGGPRAHSSRRDEPSGPRFARFWNDGHCCGLAHWRGVDDVGFLRRLIVEVGDRHGVDRRRVFVVGWSNGAMLAYAAGARLADLVVGIGPFAATMRGHDPMDWPGPVHTDRLPQQHPLRSWDVAERMWAFFAQHGR